MRGARSLIALSLLLAGCGGESKPTPAPAPRLPFPPTAQEPGKAPPAGEKPAGRVVRVGPKPEGVAIDPRTGVAAVSTADGLALVDAATGARRDLVALPAPARHLGLAEPGGPFLVPMENADALAEVSPSGGEPRITKAGAHPHDATAADGTIYVGDEFGGSVTVLRDGRKVGEVGVDVQPGGVAVAGNYLAVVSVLAYTVELIDRRSLRRMGSQNVGYGPSHVVADAGGRLYVADTRGGGVSVFQTRPRLRFIARIALPGSPYGLAIDDARDRLWVTLTARNRLAEVSLKSAKVRRTFPTVRQPNSVAADPRDGHVLVASRTDGTLQIITP